MPGRELRVSRFIGVYKAHHLLFVRYIIGEILKSADTSLYVRCNFGENITITY